jgi:myosin heavy subunit
MRAVNLNGDGVLVGAQLVEYLLELPRVTEVPLVRVRPPRRRWRGALSSAQGERSYHVFYQLLARAARGGNLGDLAASLPRQGDAAQYPFLRQSEVCVVCVVCAHVEGGFAPAR